jgi:AsnC-type helix-turn-helix domain
MTGAEKRNAILAALQEDPSRSDRAVASAIGVDHKTVAAVRTAMRAGGEIPHRGEVSAMGKFAPHVPASRHLAQ